MTSSVMWVILGMGIVTYVPRVLPLIAMHSEAIPPFLQAVLKNVPYAVLGALIFPSIFIINSGSLLKMTMPDFLFGFIGGSIAFVTAYLNWNITLVVLTSIAGLVIYHLIV
ncbi:branched-subunit amino acid transport protein [Pullulanibacillus pueri]|uniref:Transporter n=1 Tax=Pullulanibacillus pueri TaxID=1437324 RepID=A0A8J2ZZW0_9BACL|nr:AzlD domain-containing protein [Pullulanibacillus pueri]MBM7680472.1 branched-subunit amino acid transport protein [Pullulanibacillus pueri]GGH88169.1 transporter [Pullulanibacillus pueri]